MYFYEENLKKLQRFCTYQDRCHSEVRSKLIKIKVYGDTLEQIMADLIKDDFLNEERYARSYVRGKYRQSKWGRQKIKQGLKAKQVSEYCIKKGLLEIDQAEYMEYLTENLSKKKDIYEGRGLSNYPLRSKLFQYAMSRGFTSEEINNVLTDVLE